MNDQASGAVSAQLSDTSAGLSMTEQADRFRERYNTVRQQIGRVIVGHDEIVHGVLTCMMIGGHCLLEGVPGLGKTLLVRTLSQALDLKFSRIQFTPDLMPADILGTNMVVETPEGKRIFEFQRGPIFTQICLADEINRATPKTQSALLEAMEERQVTVDGTTYAISRPFLVLATQNPIEYEGTFPLPEAQVDRFLMRIHLGYPAKNFEVDMLTRQANHHPIHDLDQVVSLPELLEAQNAIREVYVDDLVKAYIVDLVTMTRDHPDVYLGASPRGSLALFLASRAWAALEGRDFVLPDDAKRLAETTLAHRLIVSPSARIKNVTPHQVIEDALKHTPVPGARVKAR